MNAFEQRSCVANGTPDIVREQCDVNLREASRFADIIRANVASPTWETTFGAFDEIAKHLQLAGRYAGLLAVVHPDAAVREASREADPKIDAFVSALYVDDAIYPALESYAKANPEQSGPRTHLIEDTLRDYRRNGRSLNAEGREKLRVLNETITKLGQEFEKHLAEATLWIEVSPAQLEGLPETYKQSHQPNEHGLVRITTDYPDIIPFLRYAKDREAAKKLSTLSQNRAKETNLPILEQLIELRHQKAMLLGYPTWADYVLEPRMAKQAATVKTFLEDLHVAVKPKREAEFAVLRDAAQSTGLTVENTIPSSDASFLEDIVLNQTYALDTQRLSEYFEVESVLNGILDISNRLYGITFQISKDAAWHEDVRVYDVLDRDGSFLGRAYLDLYPRENKYKHAAMFPLEPIFRETDGSRHIPSAALVCNFPKPGKTPALLSHDDVTTFFHEFGHLLHALLSKAELASLSGTAVAWDFVEAPSQMFEEWAWDEACLALFAKHHATHEPLPNDLFRAMINARTFGEATHVERQLFLATLDQTYHTREPGFDTTALLEELHPEFSSFARLPETHFQASFGHLVGYDAAYYGYQWANSIAKDLLTRFQAEGMLNEKTATDYRTMILEPGGEEDETEMITRFLGRPPNAEAYKRFLGISG